MPVLKFKLPDGSFGTVGGLSSVAFDHSSLTNRDAPDAHPVESVTGLQAALDSKAEASAIRVLTLAEYTALDYKTGLYLVTDEYGAVSLYAMNDLVWAKPSPWPDGLTTGVPAGTTLTTLTATNKPYAGDVFSGTEKYIVNTAGAVYTGWIFDHWVEVRAKDVQFVNCYFAGPPTIPADVALLRIQQGDRSASATRCTFRPRVTLNTDCIRGSNVTVDACDLSGTVDGVHVFGSITDRADPFAGRVTVRDSWIHDMVYMPPGTPGAPADGTHNDCVQIVGGSTITITGNRFSGAARNAGIQITQARQNVDGVTISGNLFENSSITGLNVDDTKGVPAGTAVAPLTVTDNVFRKGEQTWPMVLTIDTLNTFAQSGNVWLDGSLPAPVAVKA